MSFEFPSCTSQFYCFCRVFSFGLKSSSLDLLPVSLLARFEDVSIFQNLKAENGELRQSIAKLRKELEELSEVKEGSTESEFSSLHKAKHSLEMKCAEQVRYSETISCVSLKFSHRSALLLFLP